jgi:NAD-reducing hydrogenase large subunit
MQVSIPHTAHQLRRLMHLGQIISSHALSFFHLSAPDFLMGWDSAPESRNILGIAAKDPELARRGIRLRKFGQELSERITGKKIHSVGIAAGGMVARLTEENRAALKEWIPEAIETTVQALSIWKRYAEAHPDEVAAYEATPSLYLGLVGPEGEAELYDGRLRFVDAEGRILQDQLPASRYAEFIAEAPVQWSYLKVPFYKPFGPGAGYYRVGPLARLNVASKMKTPRAQAEFVEFKNLAPGKPVHTTMYFHYARLIETLGAIEQVDAILDDPEVTSNHTLSAAKRNAAEGIGCTEAPRGILFHHYTTDETGRLERVNLLIATGQNNPGMHSSILEIAKRVVKGADVGEGALNRVEGAIRCYDPCLSCSTHAVGTMPMVITLVGPGGEVMREIRRGEA